MLISCDKTAVQGFHEKDVNYFVDEQSPSDAKPLILSEVADGNIYLLSFSDEFNNSNIDTSKWNVQDNYYRNRGDIKLHANGEQVEEKDGHLYFYYQKDQSKNDSYFAGRVDSRTKYSITYGFLECRMHIVEPNGHQMAFWMMPEGNGMKVPDGVDGTAKDGAEIDIIEGNRENTFSCGLHWDGYGADHRSNGSKIETPGIHETEYHVFGFEWSKDFLRWYYDGKIVRELVNPKLIPQVRHYIYLSGSCFGENNWVDGDIRYNEFIQNGGVDKAYVDYIRVFKITN